MPSAPRKTEIEVSAAPLRLPFQEARGANRFAFGGATADALAGFSKTIEGLSDEAARIAVQIQIDDNEREKKLLQNDFMRRINEINVTGLSDETPAFYETQGLNTVNQAVTYKAMIDEARNEIMGMASNDRVREMFEVASDAISIREYQTMDRHTISQRVTANNMVDEATLKELQDDVAAHPFDEQRMSRALAVATELLADRSEREGWNEFVMASKTQETYSALIFKAMETAIQKDAGAAALLYDRVVDGRQKGYKGLLDGSLRPEVEKLLEDGNLRQQSQRAADDIMASAVSPKEARAMARRIDDPKLRDETMNRINRRIAEDAAEKEIVKQEVRDLMFPFLEQGGTIDEFAEEYPEAYRMALEDNALMNSARSLQNGIAHGNLYSEVSNPALFTDIVLKSPRELATFDPRPHQTNLTEGEYKQIIALRRAARASLDEGSDDFKYYDRMRGFLRESAPLSLRWGAADQTPEQRRRQNAIDLAGAQWVQQQLASGDPINWVEAKRWAQQAAAKATISRAWKDWLLDWVPFVETKDVEVSPVEARALTDEQRSQAHVDLSEISLFDQSRYRNIIQAWGAKENDRLVGQLAFAIRSRDAALYRKLLVEAGGKEPTR